MTRAHKREVDREALLGSWREQAASLGFSPDAVAEAARRRLSRGLDANLDAEAPKAGASRDRDIAGPGETDRGPGRDEVRGTGPATRAVSWAMEHLSEREAVFARSDLLAAALAWKPGAVSVEAAGQAIDALQRDGRLHAAPAIAGGEVLTTDTALADERETIGLMRTGRERGQVLMRGRKVRQHLHNGPLTDGQKQAVTAILSSKDRIVGVQGYAGTGKDGHAQPGAGARREERLPDAGPRAVRFGSTDTRRRVRHRERDAAGLSRTQCWASPRAG